MATPNRFTSREAWLKAATDQLREHFNQAGYPLPEKIRFAIALTSSGRNRDSRPGECWHSSASADETWEIIIRADKADPVEVLGILVHELVKTTLPLDAGHGKLYKKAMGPLGLQGPARYAAPTPLFNHRLTELAAALGPLPHASLDLEAGPRPAPRPVGAPKKQKNRMHKAVCQGKNDDGSPCGYTLRISSQWAEVGPPGCPKHGPMVVEPLAATDESDAEIGEIEPETVRLHALPKPKMPGNGAMGPAGDPS